MFDILQAQYLITHVNDPMGIDRGLYANLPMGKRRFVRLNHDPVGMPIEFNPLKNIFQAFRNDVWGKVANSETLIHFGGYSDIDGLHFFHSAELKFQNTLYANKSGDLRYSPMSAYLALDEVDTIPVLRKFVFGHQEISAEELQARTKAGDWEIISAPTYLTFGTKGSECYSLAKTTGRPVSDHQPKKTGGFMSILKAAKEFKSLGTNMSLHMMRSGLFLYYHSKNERPFDFEYLEKVIDVQIAGVGQDMGEITDVFEKLSREELDQKHRTLRRRTMRLPLAKENKRMRERSKTIGLNQYAYDYSFVGTVKMNKGNKGKASVRNLEREIDGVGDIVKDSDQSQPWD